jgi:tetratricopeptide (TPR) repeat protein
MSPCGGVGLTRFSTTGKGMRVLALLLFEPVAAASIANSVPAKAGSSPDFESCKLSGEASSAEQTVAACDRVLNDRKLAGLDRAVALSNRCGWRWIKREPERALSDCDEAIKVDPAYPAAYVNRGNAYEDLQDFNHALEDFNTAIRLDPKSVWAYTTRGNSYRNEGDIDHAFADFDEAIRIDPNYAIARYDRGRVYVSKGDFEHALADFDESIRLDPNYATAYFYRGYAFYIFGNNAQAIADFSKSIRLDPNASSSYFNRGVAYFLIGLHLADAEADLKKATQLDPRDAYAALWLDVAERRNNSDSHLAEAAKQLDMTAWPAPIVREFLGEVVGSTQAKSEAEARDPRKRKGLVCESDFYRGELALMKKNQPEGFRLLRLAARECPRGYIESNAALVELLRNRR